MLEVIGYLFHLEINEKGKPQNELAQIVTDNIHSVFLELY